MIAKRKKCRVIQLFCSSLAFSLSSDEVAKIDYGTVLTIGSYLKLSFNEAGALFVEADEKFSNLASIN